MAVVKANTDAVGAAQACTNHPDRETLISCGRCLRPFCTACLIHTPAGQRCYECAGVRRDYRQRAAVARFAQGFGILFLGAAIATLLGFFSFFIAMAAGNYAAQTLSPAVTRHTRPWVYVPLVLVVFFGSWFGWSLAMTARLLVFSAQRGIFLNVLSVPIAALFNAQFWIFLAIAAIVVFLRAR